MPILLRGKADGCGILFPFLRSDRYPGEQADEERSLQAIEEGGAEMPVFMMFGKYSRDSLEGMSPERTGKSVEIIEHNGGRVISMYAVLGIHDLVFTVEFPTIEKALAVSTALSMLTGISFTTSPVIDITHFDSLMSEMKNR